MEKSFRPTVGLNLISTEHLEELHLATLEVLDRTGVNVYHPEALKLLEQNGARVTDQRVRIPACMIQAALGSAPCRVPIADRQGRRAMLLEKRRIHFGMGSDTPFTVDIENGVRRKTVKQDVVNAARVADVLDNIDFVMSLGVAADVPTAAAYVHQFEAMALNSVKPIIYTGDDERDVADIIQMAELIAGGAEALAANPFLILYDEPTSPLQHGRNSIDKLLLCARKGLPVMYVPALMMGGTGPVTAAGALVVANAEALSGLVIHQLAAKGAPFIYGGAAPPMDMNTGVCSYGAPEEALNCAGIPALARYYNLPSFTTGGCSDAQVFDQQAGMEAGFTLLSAALAGGNLIHDSGYIGVGLTSSLEMLVLCNETVSVIKRYLRGPEVSAESLAVEVIANVGPGGNFLTAEHTLKHFKSQIHSARLLNRQDYLQWEAAGSLPFDRRANLKVRDILAHHRAPVLSPGVVEQVRAISASR